MLVDCYGYGITDPFYQRKKKNFYESATSGSITYMRFSTEDIGPIHKLDQTDADNPVLTWTYGSWTDRATLTYSVDLNTSINI